MSDHVSEAEATGRRDGAAAPALFSGLRSLLALNAVLLLVLGVVTFGGSAGAGMQEQQRPRGDYTMVGGRVPGFSGASAVYIVDAINREMMVVGYDRSQQRLRGIGYRNIGDDADAVGGRQQRGR